VGFRQEEARARPSRRRSENPNWGDCYTFVAIERSNDTKLVLNIALGKRDHGTTVASIEGLRAATARGRSRSPQMASRRTAPRLLRRWTTGPTSPCS
jgi:hypothetical protein